VTPSASEFGFLVPSPRQMILLTGRKPQWHDWRQDFASLVRDRGCQAGASNADAIRPRPYD